MEPAISDYCGFPVLFIMKKMFLSESLYIETPHLRIPGSSKLLLIPPLEGDVMQSAGNVPGVVTGSFQGLNLSLLTVHNTELYQVKYCPSKNHVYLDP